MFVRKYAGELLVGDVEAFAIPGLKCYFGSNDHYPHHFEVYKRGDWLIRVFFIRTTRKRGLNWEYKGRGWKQGPSRAEEDTLLTLVLKNKKRLLREWNTKVCPACEREDNDDECRNA